VLTLLTLILGYFRLILAVNLIAILRTATFGDNITQLYISNVVDVLHSSIEALDVHYNTAERTRLSGMIIKGSNSARDQETQLYQDPLHAPVITDCNGYYPESGTSVCSDVIDISVNNDLHVRHIIISTANYLNLCEVEVYAGMGN